MGSAMTPDPERCTRREFLTLNWFDSEATESEEDDQEEWPSMEMDDSSLQNRIKRALQAAIGVQSMLETDSA